MQRCLDDSSFSGGRSQILETYYDHILLLNLTALIAVASHGLI